MRHEELLRELSRLRRPAGGDAVSRSPTGCAGKPSPGRPSANPYIGVRWQRGAWVASISSEGTLRCLGGFSTAEAAARARDAAASRLHGRDAILNFPRSE